MPEYGARSTALQRKTEIYHVRQAHAGFIYGVVIVLQEEILDGAVPDEPAFFVKRHGDGAVPGTCPEGGIRPAVGFRQEADQRPPVALALPGGEDGNVLDLQDPVPLVRNHTFRLYAAVFQHVHGPPTQVAVNHVLLLVSQQEEGEVILFLCVHFFNFHGILRVYSARCMLKQPPSV